jgi:hypothetical protein
MQQQQLPSWRELSVVGNKCAISEIMGMSCRRVEWYLYKADPEAQENFLKKTRPRLEEAKSGQRAVFFVDAAHFVLGAYLGFCGVLNACLSNLEQEDNVLMSSVRLILSPMN